MDNTMLKKYTDFAKNEEIDVSIGDIHGILNGKHIGSNWQFVKNGKSYQNLKYFFMGTGLLVFVGFIYVFMPQSDANPVLVSSAENNTFSIAIEDVIEDNKSSRQVLVDNTAEKGYGENNLAHQVAPDIDEADSAVNINNDDVVLLNDLPSSIVHFNVEEGSRLKENDSATILQERRSQETYHAQSISASKKVSSMPQEYKTLTFNKEDYSAIRKFKTGKNPKLAMNIPAGNITVDGYSGNEIIILINIFKKGKRIFTDEKDKVILNNAIETLLNNGNADISFSIDKYFFRNTYAEIKVHVPSNTIGDIHTSGGNVYLNNLSAEQKAYTSGGDITIEGVKGNLVAHSGGGNLQIQNISGSMNFHSSGGNIRLYNSLGNVKSHTSGGDILIETLQGNVDANTSGGNIQLKLVSGFMISASTNGGNISMNDVKVEEVTGTTAGGNVGVSGSVGGVKAKSGGGNIEVNSTRVSSELDLKTRGGNINVLIPDNVGITIAMNGDQVNFDQHNFNGKSNKKHVDGTINGGGIPVTIDANGGNANLTWNR